VASLLADVSPLRHSRPFRRLWFGLAVTSLGSQMTVVAIAFQAYELTHSTAIVGLVSLTGLLPTLVGSLGGGTIADAVDRRRLLVLTQILFAASSGALVANALLPSPRLWVLFLASATTAAVQGLDWPTRLAVMPMILTPEDLPSAYALQSVVNNVAVIAGPALAGFLIARVGIGWVYLADVISYGATLIAAILLPKLPPVGGGTAATFSSMVEGLRFLRSQKLLAATFILDLNAMIFGMPKAVFPAFGTEVLHGGAATVGLLYAAPGAGALLASVLSGWVKHVSFQARALVLCMFVWGGAIAVFGLIPVLWVALVLLAVAGGSDVIGGVFRVAILQRSTPDHLQGRLGGLFFAAAVSGNRLGDGEAGLAASIGGTQFAVWSGGLACIVGTALLAWRIPQLWRKDRATVGNRVVPPPALDPLGDPAVLPD
jgi:predicted MFS family arabinose efflux permease